MENGYSSNSIQLEVQWCAFPVGHWVAGHCCWGGVWGRNVWKGLRGRGEGGGWEKLGARSWGVGEFRRSQALPSLQIVTNCNACSVSLAAPYMHYIIHLWCLCSSLSDTINRRKLAQCTLSLLHVPVRCLPHTLCNIVPAAKVLSGY